MALDPLIPELCCADLKASLDFYVHILGFKILYQRPEDQFAMLEREGAKIMIEGMVGRKWITAPLEYPCGRGIHFQITVRDVVCLYNSVKKVDYPIYLDLEEKWYRIDENLGGNKQFLLQDPDGYLLRFAQDLGTKPADSQTL